MKKNFLTRLLIVPGALLSLQSCFVAKDYKRPPEVLKAESYRTDQLEQDTANMAEVSWRELFTDPVLTAHIEEALANNIDIRIALQQLKAAGAYLKQSKLAQLPSISAGASVVHQNPAETPATFGSESFTQYEIVGDMSWEADIWGKIKSNQRAVKAAYLQSIAGHKAVKTALIANIASLYYELLALDQQLEITIRTVETREQSLETMEALKDAGTVTEVGVQQTQAQLYRARAVVIDLKLQIRILENALSIILGEMPQHIERTDLERQQIQTPLQFGVPAQLLRNRPDVIAAEYNLINAFELTNVARGEFYPSLRISASTGFQSLELENLLNANALFSSVIGSLAEPIFNRRQIRTAYEVAQAEQEIAYLEFREALLIAAREVSDALYNYEAADEKLEVKSQELQSYELAVDYSEQLLENGLVNYLEVLTARENALNAALERVRLRYEELNAVVELYQALGGGWR